MPHHNPNYETMESTEDSREEEELAKAALRPVAKSWWQNPLWMWTFQGVVAATCALMVGYVTLWMDSHNDTRYVIRNTYQKDNEIFMERYKDNRENDRKDREAIRNENIRSGVDINKRLDRQEIQLDTIASDIKNLLRQAK